MREKPGLRRISLKWLWEEVRRSPLRTEGKPYKLDNSLTSAAARDLAYLAHPPADAAASSISNRGSTRDLTESIARQEASSLERSP